MRKTGQKHMGFMSGGMGIFKKRKKVEAGEPDQKKKRKNPIEVMKEKKDKRLKDLRKELGMKKGGSMKKPDGVMLIIEGKADGGITGKTTFGELKKRFKPLKKGIRLKGKGSSFMKEYKKRVYNRAGGGSVNGGARGTGIAVKGHNFKGVF